MNEFTANAGLTGAETVVSVQEARALYQSAEAAYRQEFQDGREATDADVPLMETAISTGPDRLMDALESDLAINSVTLPASFQDAQTPEAVMQSVLGASYDALQEHGQTADLDVMSRASVLRGAYDMEMGAAIEQAQEDVRFVGISSDGLPTLEGLTGESLLDTDLPYSGALPDMVDPLYWQMPGNDGVCYGIESENHPFSPELFDMSQFDTTAPTMGIKADVQLSAFLGGDASIDTSFDFENMEFSFEGKLGVCEGTRADASLEIYSQPSVETGSYARLATSTVGEVDAGIRTPLASLEAGLKAEVGAEYRTDEGLDVINQVDPRLIAGLGPLRMEDNGRVSSGVGAALGASVCQEGTAGFTVSAGDVLPSVLYDDPNRSVLDDYEMDGAMQ